MIKKILTFIKQAGAAKESDTERDGFLSYSAETHGLVVGFYHGFIDFRDWEGLPDDINEKNGIENNWYTKGGYIGGAILRVSIYLLLGAIAMRHFL